MSKITTHVLDTARGRPASGISVTLFRTAAEDAWTPMANGTTDQDGRVSDLLDGAAELSLGTYRLRFEVGPYFVALGADAFYPFVDVVFTVVSAEERYHVPLLLNPFGYSTYRGS